MHFSRPSQDKRPQKSTLQTREMPESGENVEKDGHS